MEELISIVMPVYNAERFLRKSIDSVILQTYKKWELIIVNDGSTDNSVSIITEYISKHKNIKLFSIKNSGSAKYPRDMAIAYSNGNYIITLDADDYLDVDYLQKMWNRHNETNADIVFPKMVYFKENSLDIIGYLPLKEFDTNKIYSGRDLVKYTLKKWVIGCNGGLYKKYIMNNLSYPIENFNNLILMNSDEYDTRQYILNSQIITFSNAKYFYCINETAITKNISIKRFDVLETDKMLIDLIGHYFSNNTQEYELIQEQIYNNFLYHIKYFINNRSNFTKNEKKMIYHKLKSSFKHIEKKTIVKICLRNILTL